MDGIAIASEAWRAGQRRFRIAGTQAAGARPQPLPADACLEVMTGAVLPPGSDCVIPVERLAVADGWAEIEADYAVEPFGNVHTRGLDCREGDLLLARGTRLGPPELAVLASAGLPRADVRAEPRILVDRHRRRTGRARRADRGLAGATLQLLRAARRAHAARLPARRRGSPARRPGGAARAARRAPRHARRAGAVGRRVDGPLRPRAARAARPRRRPRCSTTSRSAPASRCGSASGRPGQAVFGLPGNPVSSLVCLVRYVVPGLQAAGRARAAAAGAGRARRALPRQARAVVFPAGAARFEPGARHGGPAPRHAAARATSCRCSAPTVSSSCRPARGRSPPGTSRRSIAGEAHAESRPVADQASSRSGPRRSRATGSAGRCTTCASR